MTTTTGLARQQQARSARCTARQSMPSLPGPTGPDRGAPAATSRPAMLRLQKLTPISPGSRSPSRPGRAQGFKLAGPTATTRPGPATPAPTIAAGPSPAIKRKCDCRARLRAAQLGGRGLSGCPWPQDPCGLGLFPRVADPGPYVNGTLHVPQRVGELERHRVAAGLPGDGHDAGADRHLERAGVRADVLDAVTAAGALS